MDASLLDFQVDFGGRSGFPCYISTRIGESGYQLNVILPEGLPTGPCQVHAVFRSRPIQGTHEIMVVEAAQFTPKVVGVTDGLDVGCTVVRSNSLKVLVENIEDPSSISFRIGDQKPVSLEFVCADSIAAQFEFALTFSHLSPGRQMVRWFERNVELSPFSIEVQQ